MLAGKSGTNGSTGMGAKISVVDGWVEKIFWSNEGELEEAIAIGRRA